MINLVRAPRLIQGLLRAAPARGGLLLRRHAAASSRLPLHQPPVTALSADWADELSDLLLATGAEAITLEEHRPPGAPEQEAPVEQHMADIETNSGRSLQFTVQPVATAQWSEAVKVRDAPSQLAPLHAVLGASRAMLAHGATPDAVALTLAMACLAAKASYQPIAISDALTIVPAWHDAPTYPANTPAPLHLILEPGLAFGTGDHATTQLCLRWLLRQRASLEGASVVDYGTGSGVLAIAALLLGARCVAGTDTDALAVKASQRNAALNDVAGALTVVHCQPQLNDDEPLAAHGLAACGYDVVLANILQGPLLDLGPRLSAYVRPGGLLALSGILETQAPAVVEAYAEWFEDLQVESQGQWVLVTGRRSAA